MTLRWALLLPALVVPFILSFFYFVFYPGTVFGNSFYTIHKVFLIAWPLLAVLLILREPMVDRSRPKRHLASLLPGVVFAGLTVGLLFALIHFTPLGKVLAANETNIAGRIADLGMAEHFVAFALFLSFIHAAMEEFYWRWFAFGQAKQLMPVGLAHLAAAVGVASHHVVILSQFFPLGWALVFGACVALGGAFWSWQANRYNSLIGPWFSHMIIDLGLMWVGWEVLQRTQG
ncbi:MAG: CPBP family intramembrane glutamic endopeptidase [Verrucomicrobiales bacterium]